MTEIEPIPECLPSEQTVAAKVNEMLPRVNRKWAFGGDWAAVKEEEHHTVLTFTPIRRYEVSL